MTQVLDLIRRKPSDFMVISGDDFTSLITVLAGGAGVISVLGQGVPQEFSRMIRLGLEANVKEAFVLQYALQEAMELIFKEGNPAGIKAIFESLGLSNAKVRLPLIEASDALKSSLHTFVHQLAPQKV